MPQAIFKCTVCNVSVTNALSELEDKSRLNEKDGNDHIPPGFYTVEDGGYYLQAHGQYVVNLKDLINTKHHPDSKRLQGCCGLDGGDGINTVCINGHEVGTERSDCWMAHAITFERGLVLLRLGTFEPDCVESDYCAFTCDSDAVEIVAPSRRR